MKVISLRVAGIFAALLSSGFFYHVGSSVKLFRIARALNSGLHESVCHHSRRRPGDAHGTQLAGKSGYQPQAIHAAE